MKNLTNKMIYNWIYILIIMLLSFLLLGIYILYSGRILTDEATESFHSYNLNDRKSQLKSEIQNRLDEIAYERKNLLVNEKLVLKAKIHQIHTILLSSEILNIADKDERTLTAIKAFEEITSNDPEYLYFVINSEGSPLISGTDDQLVGTNLYDSVDVEGRYYIQSILKAQKSTDGLYVDYFWPKIKDGPPLMKTSYCYYLPEFDFIIGTGIYHQDIQTKLQNKIYSRLQSYYENKENYVFVVEYDSLSRVHGNPSFLGTYISDALSYDGKSIHQLFMDIIETEGSGYGSYQFSLPNDTELSEKMSFVHDLEGWDAYIGIGFYVDDLNAEVENFSVLFKKHYYNQALYTIIGLLLIAIIVFAVIQRGTYLQTQYLKQEDLIFENLFNLSSEAIIVISKNGDLLYANSNAESLFHHHLDEFVGDQGFELEHVEEQIHTFRTHNDRIVFVSIKEEVISFKGRSSIIHFISDITSQYLESNAFEQMAYSDSLTGLPNRRALVDKYEDFCFSLEKDETMVLGIIDIDHFKQVNDTYGHNIGDQTLKILCSTFTSRLRHHDYLFRYGGEEFVVLLNNINLNQAKSLLEDLNRLFASNSNENLSFTCTYSCGLIMIDATNKNQTLEDQISRADDLMYKAKQNGRNTIEI